MEDCEVPVSGIRSWTYTLVSAIAYTKRSPLIATSEIEALGFEKVVAFRDRAMESPLNKGDAVVFL